MKRCPTCGNRNVAIIKNGAEIKVVCPICGEEGKPAHIGDRNNKYIVENYKGATDENDLAKTVAIINWNAN